MNLAQYHSFGINGKSLLDACRAGNKAREIAILTAVDHDKSVIQFHFHDDSILEVDQINMIAKEIGLDE